MKDIVGLNDGRNTLLVNVHTIDQCTPGPCCVHNPSQHHMSIWPPAWDGAYGTMWRRCPHGNRHPDPDDLNYRRIRNMTDARIQFRHFCDGCCQPTPAAAKEIEGGNDDGNWPEGEKLPIVGGGTVGEG